MNKERTGKCLRQVEHIRGHLSYEAIYKALYTRTNKIWNKTQCFIPKDGKDLKQDTMLYIQGQTRFETRHNELYPRTDKTWNKTQCFIPKDGKDLKQNTMLYTQGWKRLETRHNALYTRTDKIWKKHNVLYPRSDITFFNKAENKYSLLYIPMTINIPEYVCDRKSHNINWHLQDFYPKTYNNDMFLVCNNSH